MANTDCRIEVDHAGKAMAPETNAREQAQLGCYDQLMKDSQKAYPGDPLLQRAAVEEKMGPSNFTFGQQKLLEANREFIDMPPLQALAVKEAEFKYFNQGKALTPAEQAKLDAPRAAKETAADIERFMPAAKMEFPDSPALQNLAAREGHFEATGRDKLSNADYARLYAGKDYPQDKAMQDLDAKVMLHRLDPSKPGLTPAEQVRFTSAQLQGEIAAEFPNDKNLQHLALKDRLTTFDGQPKMTKEESAVLWSARAYPDSKELQHLCVEKELAGTPGHKGLTEAQEKTLAKADARREFPEDAKLQEISLKERLWLAKVPGANGLDREEYKTLRTARDKMLLKALGGAVSRL